MRGWTISTAPLEQISAIWEALLQETKLRNFSTHSTALCSGYLLIAISLFCYFFNFDIESTTSSSSPLLYSAWIRRQSLAGMATLRCHQHQWVSRKLTFVLVYSAIALLIVLFRNTRFWTNFAKSNDLFFSSVDRVLNRLRPLFPPRES